MKKIIFFFTILFFLSFSAFSEYDKEVLIEPVLKTDKTSIGQGIDYPDFKDEEVSILKVTIPSGKATGWHKHSFPVFAYVLKGNLTIELEENKTLEFPENSSFAEVIDTFHNGKNNGKEDVILIAFFMGEKDKPLSVKKQALPRS